MSAKTILITGANRGLGRAIMESLMRAGEPYTILATARSLQAAEDAVQACSAQASPGSVAVAMQCDLEDEASIVSLAEEVQKRYGKLDGIVHNAGAALDSLAVDGVTSATIWSRSFMLHATGPNLLSTHLMPVLLKSESPRILFITSSVGSFEWNLDPSQAQWPINRSPAAGWPKHYEPPAFSSPAYKASKAAMNMLAVEWARTTKNDSLRIFLVDPGVMATDFGGLPAEFKRQRGVEGPKQSADLVREVIEGVHDATDLQIISKEEPVGW